MDRLNFTQLVNRTLIRQQENKFFHVTQIYPNSYFESEIYAAKIKQAKERLNLDGKMRNIVFNVHEQLRERQSSSPSPSRVKTKSNQQDKSKAKLKTKKEFSAIQQISTQTGSDIEDVLGENNTIPRMKVLCSDKHQECCHKTTKPSSNCLSFESHKRIMLAQRRKTVLENMIKEHNLLKADGQSLEQDIFAMRHCLDDLQHRVNSSLQQLHNKKTFCECNGLINNKNCDKCKENN